jgi:hypothetical protein
VAGENGPGPKCCKYIIRLDHPSFVAESFHAGLHVTLQGGNGLVKLRISHRGRRTLFLHFKLNQHSGTIARKPDSCRQISGSHKGGDLPGFFQSIHIIRSHEEKWEMSARKVRLPEQLSASEQFHIAHFAFEISENSLPRQRTLSTFGDCTMPIGPSDLPWWGWLLIAAVAGIVYRVGMGVTNDARLESPTPARWYVGFISAGIGMWTAVLTAGIGIASLPYFWSLAVLAGLLVLTVWGLASLHGQVTRAESEIRDQLTAILQKLTEDRRPD